MMGPDPDACPELPGSRRCGWAARSSDALATPKAAALDEVYSCAPVGARRCSASPASAGRDEFLPENPHGGFLLHYHLPDGRGWLNIDAWTTASERLMVLTLMSRGSASSPNPGALDRRGCREAHNKCARQHWSGATHGCRGGRIERATARPAFGPDRQEISGPSNARGSTRPTNQSEGTASVADQRGHHVRRWCARWPGHRDLQAEMLGCGGRPGSRADGRHQRRDGAGTDFGYRGA